MRKIYSVALIFLSFTFLVVDSLLAAGTTIYNFEGKASVRRDNTVYQADYDMPCRTNDILRSDKEGFIDLTMTQFAATRMLGAGECLLKRVETNNKIIQLNYGTMIANLLPMESDGSFEIETPIVSVSVSGAQFKPKPKNNHFMVIHEKNKTGPSRSTVISKQGDVNVRVKESHTAVTVLEGRMLRVEEHAFAPTARNASEEELLPLAKANSIYINID